MKLHLYPAALAAVLNAVIAVISSFTSPTTAHWLTVLATAVVGLVVALTTRPVIVGTVTAAVGTIFTALAGFGLHLSSHWTALLTTGIALLVGFFTHQNATPLAAHRQGKTAYEIEKVRA